MNIWKAHRKMWVGLIGAVATWVTSTYPDIKFVGLAIAVLTAAGVYGVANQPPEA